MSHPHFLPTPGDDGRAAAGMIGAAGSGLYAWAMDSSASTVIGAMGVVVSMLIPLLQPIIRDWAASRDAARLREMTEMHTRLMEKLEFIKKLEGDLTALREYYLIERRPWPPAPPVPEGPATPKGDDGFNGPG